MFVFHFHLSLEDEDKIYIETENGFFPCIGWNDLLLSVVSMWVGNTIKTLETGYEKQIVPNYFMDGPYSFDIQKTGEERIEVKFIKHGWETDNEEMPFLNIKLTDYCNALLNLAENIIRDPNFPKYSREQERINFPKNVALLRTRLQTIPN